MDTTDQPNSLCHISAIQMYNLPSIDVKTSFTLLKGEAVLHSGKSVDGPIFITNYRLFLQLGEIPHHIPLGLIEIVEHRELFFLQIGCKDARTYRCTFENNETCLEWYDKIQKASEPPRQLDQLFAFYFSNWCKEDREEDVLRKLERHKDYSFDKRVFEAEFKRMKFNNHSWKICEVNVGYKFCPTYPPYLLVPSCISDETLELVAKFRSSRRIPAVVWRHTENKAVIARCSQPEVGWLGWRSNDDEDLIKAISDACHYDSSEKVPSEKEVKLSRSPGSVNSDDTLEVPPLTTQQKKVLIMDARSYTTAVANRARGGGCECPEYYPNCEIQFMNLANIHSIRKSFHNLRQLCSSSAEQPNWFSQLEGTRWLSHMSVLMKAAVTLVNAVERDARPVLVHCSDGWDRTPQIVALGELLLDPFYRTMDGFRILIEKEWLAFGHKFADRCGHSSGSEDQNERCPVFLQWLDCVHQLLFQFPCAFEFSQTYLVKLVQHTYSNLFGTFLCNTQQERNKLVYGQTFSIWDFLNTSSFQNHLYAPPGTNNLYRKVLWPQCNVRDLHLWSEVYLGSMEANSMQEFGSGACPGPPDSFPHHMTKTRSFGDLNSGFNSQRIYRRCSDPNINIEKRLNSSSQEPADLMNGFAASNFSSDAEEDCKEDCVCKSSDQLTDDQIDGDLYEAEAKHFMNNVIRNSDKTDCKEEVDAKDCKGDINHNDREEEEDEAAEEKSESKSENTVFENDLGNNQSVETSTETLVSENVFKNGCREASQPIQVVAASSTDRTDSCQNCSVTPNFSQANSETSRLSSQNLSGDSSSNGWDSMPNLPHYNSLTSCQYSLGEDGLVHLRSPVQERLNQIMEDQKRTEKNLLNELHIYRMSRIKQVCHRCNPGEFDKQDDSSSVVESVGSIGEGQISAIESLPSDASWEPIEGHLYENTRWVPDFACSSCSSCRTEFWLGKRRHHCRYCGNIFCADCSEKSIPLPSQSLFNPVRVCNGCFEKVKTSSVEDLSAPMFDEKLDHTKPPQANHNTQITASSN